MSFKVLLILLLVGLLAVKTTNAQDAPVTDPLTGILQGLLGIVLNVLGVVPALIQAILQSLTDAFAPKPDVNNCGVLKNGTQYHIKIADGRFAVVDVNTQLAFMKSTSEAEATKFTAVQQSCNVYGLCVNGFCMSRCEGCTTDTGDFETVKFHIDNSNFGYSQWNLTSITGVAGGPYVLQTGDVYFLTYKPTQNGDQLTLTANQNEESVFGIIEN